MNEGRCAADGAGSERRERVSTDSDRRPGTLWVMARRAVGLLAACAICLILLLRTVALDSDPYARLSWSSGLLTDEGYYIHNARNLVLFGTERTDEFNNMLIMPTLHFVQVAVFRQWGPGVVSARMISVVCSLFAILVLYAAARRAFGAKVAGFAALFVGLDHTNLLYNRMALMDTPGEMLLVFALYAWVRGMPIRRDGAVSRGWLVACGALLAFAFVTRGLAGIAIPAAALAVWLTSRHAGRALHTGSERQADPSPAVTLGTTFRWRVASPQYLPLILFSGTRRIRSSLRA